MANILKSKDLVAILSDSERNAITQKRINGAQTQAGKYPEIYTRGPVYVQKDFDISKSIDPTLVSSEMEKFYKANRNLDGWLSVINLVQFNASSIPWKPGEVQLAAATSEVDAGLKAIEDNYVQALLVYGYYQTGRECVRILYEAVA